MKHFILCLALVFATCSPRFAECQIDVDATITVDNAYGFGFGSATAMTTYFGGLRNTFANEIFNGPPTLYTAGDANAGNGYTNFGIGPELYSVQNIALSDFIYIVCWSDDDDFQGLIASFEINGNGLLTGDSENWEVFATGIDRDSDIPTDTLTISDLPLINQQIAIANSNSGNSSTTSIGWVDENGMLPNNTPGVGRLVYGETNVLGSTFNSVDTFTQVIQGVDPASQWQWYNEDPANISNPFRASSGGGSDGHAEFLIFRLPVSALTSDCLFESDNILCDLDDEGQLTGDFIVTGSFTNLQNTVGTHLLLPPNAISPAGVQLCFGDGSNVLPVDPPIGNGDSVEIGANQSNENAIIIKNALPGDEVCFRLILLGENGVECCETEICLTMPPCDCLQVDRRCDVIENVVCETDAVGNMTICFDYTFKLTNLFGQPIYHTFLAPLDNTSFLPDYFDLFLLNGNAPLGQGETILLTTKVTVTNLQPGDTIEFLITIHNEDFSECCTRPHSLPVPECTPGMLGPMGDINEDGTANLLDVALFVDLLGTGGFHVKADINLDGVVNLLDVHLFVNILSGG